MLQTGYRFVEACALMPMMFVPQNRENAVMCTGAQAETLAAHALRWRDVTCVYLREKPIRPLSAPNDPIFKDKGKRVIVTHTPPVGSCSAILTTPGEDPDPYLGALTADGVCCVSRYDVDEVQPMFWHMRRLFRAIVPWRDFIPQELYGVLACPRGKPEVRRDAPTSAKRMNRQYVTGVMLNFAQEELPMVYGPPSVKTDKAPPPKATHG